MIAEWRQVAEKYCVFAAWPRKSEVQTCLHQAAYKTVNDALPLSKDSGKRGVTKWGEKSC